MPPLSLTEKAARASNARLADLLEKTADQHPREQVQAAMRDAARRLRTGVAMPADTAAAAYEPLLLLDGTAHVLRDGRLTKIPGGVLVRDTDLRPSEIDELTAQRFVRYATSDEIARLVKPAPDPADAADADAADAVEGEA